MSFPADGFVISKSAFDAAIFDLDGAATQTTKIQVAASTGLFDEFLGRKEKRLNAADYSLKNPEEVRIFLQNIIFVVPEMGSQ